MGSIFAYISVFRPDHWVKNSFILIGVAAAYFAGIPFSLSDTAVDIIIAFALTSLAASANYGINEILDCERDKEHPTKCNRALPSGLVPKYRAWIGCAILYVVVLFGVYLVSFWTYLSVISLLVMGILYNVPPVRLKDRVYIDVLSESLNNPIRLSIGWFAVQNIYVPPVSFTTSFWLFGAFLMAGKRFAEYRYIGNPERAASYRNSFGHYNEVSLLISMMVYATGFLYLLGVISVKYDISVMVSTPLIMVFIGYYFRLAMERDSIVKQPERLCFKKEFVVLSVLIFITIILARKYSIPFLKSLNRQVLKSLNR